jgi:hypothetical protein
VPFDVFNGGAVAHSAITVSLGVSIGQGIRSSNRRRTVHRMPEAQTRIPQPLHSAPPTLHWRMVRFWQFCIAASSAPAFVGRSAPPISSRHRSARWRRTGVVRRERRPCRLGHCTLSGHYTPHRVGWLRSTRSHICRICRREQRHQIDLRPTHLLTAQKEQREGLWMARAPTPDPTVLGHVVGNQS